MTALSRHAVLLFYIAGSLCFLAGSMLSLVRAMRPERASSLISEPQANAFEVHPSSCSDTEQATP